MTDDFGGVVAEIRNKIMDNLVVLSAKSDCEAVFGFFLHHFPYLGLRGAEDETRWRQQAAETHRLFKEHFGINLEGASVGACSESGCGGSACDGGSCDSGACSSGDTSDLLRVRPRLVRS